jgi:cytochrome c-type biogenesis protein CcmH
MLALLVAWSGQRLAQAQDTVVAPAPTAPAVGEQEGMGATYGADPSSLTDPAEAELDALAAEVAGELRCPVCRNQSVLESNAELSREMQSVVRERLAAGETPEQVKAYFVSRYGEWILLQPRARGINLLVYGLPGVALVVGLVLARSRLRKWAGAGSSGATTRESSDALSGDDERWIREALRES